MSTDRLTINFHQSRCGRVRVRGQDVGVPGLPPASLKILHYLLGILARCVEMWPFGLLRSQVQKPCEKLVFISVYMAVQGVKRSTTTTFFICYVALSDDMPPPTSILALYSLLFSPFSCILNMVCIDLFSSTN